MLPQAIKTSGPQRNDLFNLRRKSALVNGVRPPSQALYWEKHLRAVFGCTPWTPGSYRSDWTRLAADWKQCQGAWPWKIFL